MLQSPLNKRMLASTWQVATSRLSATEASLTDQSYIYGDYKTRKYNLNFYMHIIYFLFT